jgi:hypothetical protein
MPTAATITATIFAPIFDRENFLITLLPLEIASVCERDCKFTVQLRGIFRDWMRLSIDRQIFSDCVQRPGLA